MLVIFCDPGPVFLRSPAESSSCADFHGENEMKSLRFSHLLLATLALAFASHASASTEKILHDFVPLPFGANPSAPLIQDSAGNLYGETATGGAHGLGVVFKLTPNPNGGWSQKVLHAFSGSPDGSSPQGRLVLDSAGNLYGTTYQGGTYGCGTAYRLSPSSGNQWTETILYSFCANSTDAAFPLAGLTFDQAGNLYGTAGGGPNGWGAVYQLSPSSNGNWTEQVLYSFSSKGPGGYSAQSEVVLDNAGNIYGTTTLGGNLECNIYGTYGGDTSGCGTVFELTLTSSGWTETVLYTFVNGGDSYTEGYFWGATGRLLIDSKGNLFGPAAFGVIYELQPGGQSNWTYTAIQPLYSNIIYGDLAFDSAGNIYGETSGQNQCGDTSCGSVFELQNTSTGWNLITLYNFSTANGLISPAGGVTLDASGNVFGVSYRSESQHYAGAVFELTQSSTGTWQESTLLQFAQVDGDNPIGDLIADSAGNLYGVTLDGGGNTACLATYACGVVFRLSPQQGGGWQYDILYDFSAYGEIQYIGTGPVGPTGLMFDSAGNLYGTALYGGQFNGGAVFKLSPDAGGMWKETTLYSFGAYRGDGLVPQGTLVMDGAGNLYGVTGLGGASALKCGCYGNGSVFELSPQPDGTWQEKLLYSFIGRTDGDSPSSGLVFDQLGNLYGATWSGGNFVTACQWSCGVIYKLSPSSNGTWTESVIHSFTDGADGAFPRSNLIFDSSGNLYGTASGGGHSGNGAVFKLTPTASGPWTESTLYGFRGGATGYYPLSDVTFDSAGNLYGTTYYGGNQNCFFQYSGVPQCGTIYKLTPSSGGEWGETILHSFGSNLTDGAQPRSGVYIDPSGNLFTMTTSGPGANSGGTLVEITP
jgi:uncharacterized repeat protein (TIGR03803 family)